MHAITPHEIIPRLFIDIAPEINNIFEKAKMCEEVTKILERAKKLIRNGYRIRGIKTAKGGKYKYLVLYRKGKEVNISVTNLPPEEIEELVTEAKEYQKHIDSVKRGKKYRRRYEREWLYYEDYENEEDSERLKRICKKLFGPSYSELKRMEEERKKQEQLIQLIRELFKQYIECLAQQNYMNTLLVLY